MGSSLSENTIFQQGREYFENGQYARALESFEQAHARDEDDATVRSYYGLCVGLVEHNFERAAELCRSAAKQEFFNPEQYLNLARVHLSFDFKAEGIRYLRRGRMIDPGHLGIAAELAQLGVRGQPVLAFLPRRHMINRWLGAIRQIAVRGGDHVAA
jgi:tetratricopeptide (TPR) repeat protein